jgi:hypothetical protein
MLTELLSVITRLISSTNKIGIYSLFVATGKSFIYNKITTIPTLSLEVLLDSHADVY